MAFEVPVLLIIFNRPDVTAEVMATLLKVRPRRLFIAADWLRLNVLIWNKEREDFEAVLVASGNITTA